MLLVKHHVGHGAWHVHETFGGLEFTGPHVLTEILASPTGGRYGLSTPDGRDFWAAEMDRLPRHDLEAEVVLVSLSEEGRTWVRWVSWLNERGERELLVTDAPVYLMNERGNTVESLR